MLVHTFQINSLIENIFSDLHFENLLVDDGDNLVLTYMCNINDLTDAFINKNVSYLAPEIYSFQPLTTTVDWWCYGLIMYKLLVGMVKFIAKLFYDCVFYNS